LVAIKYEEIFSSLCAKHIISLRRERVASAIIFDSRSCA